MLRVIAAITCLLGLGGARAGSEEAVALKADSQAMVDFQGWASGGGIDLKKVALAPELGPGLRGLVAAEDVAVRLRALSFDAPKPSSVLLAGALARPLCARAHRDRVGSARGGACTCVVGLAAVAGRFSRFARWGWCVVWPPPTVISCHTRRGSRCWTCRSRC
jgi:hypothetical protein